MIARIAVFVLAAACGASDLHAQYDILIRGGRMLDGSGNPWRYADVAITGDRIAAVGDLSGATARRVVDATGLYVTPGFIDAHSHAGPGLATPGLSHGQPLLTQGITTVVVNPDGGGPVDLVAQRDALLSDGIGVNVATMVPHGSVRRAVLGMDDRAPTGEELDRMRALVRQGMEAGAYGLSSGLYYAPASYAETDEVIELAKVASEYHGIYASHVRDEADYSIGVIGAVDEVIRVAREADIPAVHTHIKALGPRVWGFGQAIVHRIERARAEGLEVYADQYPYGASSTGLSAALIPRWAQVGGRDRFVERLRSRDEWERMRPEIMENFERRGGADRLQFRRFEPDPSIEGRTVQAVADERGLAPIDLVRQILLESEVGVVSFNMHDDDIEALMTPDWTMTASDGGLVPWNEGVPHPRGYGTFPRKIRKYVIEDGVVTLSQAVRSMTTLPALVHGMDDRGAIRAGAIADIAVFDLERLRDKATFDRPHQLSEGMVYVFVNGEPAIDSGEFTEELHGRVLSRGRAPLQP